MDDAGAVIEPGDPERDAGWLVSTPWLGRDTAVFALTQERAMQLADVSRLLHVEKLEAEAEKWSLHELQARFVEEVVMMDHHNAQDDANG